MGVAATAADVPEGNGLLILIFIARTIVDKEMEARLMTGGQNTHTDKSVECWAVMRRVGCG